MTTKRRRGGQPGNQNARKKPETTKRLPKIAERDEEAFIAEAAKLTESEYLKGLRGWALLEMGLRIRRGYASDALLATVVSVTASAVVEEDPVRASIDVIADRYRTKPERVGLHAVHLGQEDPGTNPLPA